jgi:hypothetical protein
MFEGCFMEDWVFGVALGILMLLTGLLLVRLELCHKSLIYTLQGASSEFNNQLGKKEMQFSDDLFENLRSEIQDTVTDLLSNMKTPTAIDHLAGVASQIMMMREQWKIQKEASSMEMPNNLVAPTGEYGTSQESQ